MKRFTLIASGYLLLVQNERILLSRRLNTGYEDGKYGVPSGHLEEHETVRLCCAREAKEEIGIQVDLTHLELVHVMHRKKNDERIDFFFRATEWNGTITNMEPDKCDSLEWFSLTNLPDNTIPYIREAISAMRTHSIYAEHGWNL